MVGGESAIALSVKQAPERGRGKGWAENSHDCAACVRRQERTCETGGKKKSRLGGKKEGRVV